MKKFLKIFFTTLFIIHCSSDISSEDILSDNNGNEGGGGFTGGGNETIPELDVELITTYNEQTASFSTNFGNYQRNFIVHVPPNFDYETQSLPLVFVLHGYTSQAPIIREYSGFDQIADQENFIVVYVQGTTDAFGNTGWNVNVVPTFNLVDDVGFFEALIKYFKASYNIDSSKIFSSGMSLGGFMSYRLACELKKLIVLDLLQDQWLDIINVIHPKNPALFIFMELNDAVVPYDGVEWSLSARDAHNFWKNHNAM